MNQRTIKEYAAKLAAEKGRRVPLWEAEEEMVKVIQRVAKVLAPKYVFGYQSRDDIAQQGVMYGLEVMSEDPCKYDVTRPLENFIHIHIRNQLSNFKRKLYMRLEAPCTCCNPFDPPPNPCKKWQDWHARNASKQNLMRPLDMSNVSDEGESRMSVQSNVEDEAVSNELLSLIDARLPVELRADYLRMREHVMVPKTRRQRVREAVLAILRPSDADDGTAQEVYSG